MSKLSVIIVNFNTYNFLHKCIESIHKNSGRLDVEIIVVDNASKDGTVKKIFDIYPKVKLIANKKNVGFAKANNQGIKKASGEYILLLNPDTLISDKVLEEMVIFMEENPHTAVATCKVLLEGGKIDDACHRGFPTPWNAFCHFSGLSGIFPQSKILNGYHLGYCDLDKVHEIDACAGAFMMVRKNVGVQVKWLDEDYFWYGEDLDFCFRVKAAGWKIMFVPYVSITHYKGVSGGIKEHSRHLSTADKKTRILATKARFDVMRIFYRKHYQNKYPSWVAELVLVAIRFKEYLTLLKYK